MDRPPWSLRFDNAWNGFISTSSIINEVCAEVPASVYDGHWPSGCRPRRWLRHEIRRDERVLRGTRGKRIFILTSAHRRSDLWTICTDYVCVGGLRGSTCQGSFPRFFAISDCTIPLGLPVN